MANEPIRVAVIGAGAIARSRHIPGLQAVEGVMVVAVCNRSEESGRRTADEFGIDRVVTDPEAIFADGDIDVVCIGTWPYRHREYTLRALEAGKHVLCEARMAMNASEARDMLAASQAHPDLTTQVVPGLFDADEWRTIRRLVATGELGDIREVHVTGLNANALNDAQLHWREQRRYSGTNTMFLGIMAEVLNRWMGPVERVIADAGTFIISRDDPAGGDGAIDIPDSLGVLARMENGAHASMRLSTVLHDAPAGNQISLYGSAATLHWRQGRGMTLAALGEGAQPLPPDPGTDTGWRVEADFIASIREGAPVELTSFADGVHYMRFVDAVWQSWNDGRAVALADV